MPLISYGGLDIPFTLSCYVRLDIPFTLTGRFLLIREHS
jgi:hypothetical protein